MGEAAIMLFKLREGDNCREFLQDLTLQMLKDHGGLGFVVACRDGNMFVMAFPPDKAAAIGYMRELACNDIPVDGRLFFVGEVWTKILKADEPIPDNVKDQPGRGEALMLAEHRDDGMSRETFIPLRDNRPLMEDWTEPNNWHTCEGRIGNPWVAVGKANPTPTPRKD